MIYLTLQMPKRVTKKDHVRAGKAVFLVSK